MQDPRPVGIGIIGLGMVAGTHARALADLGPAVTVTGAYSLSRERREAFCAEHGYPCPESAEALISDDSTDIVLLLTPPNARQELVALCAKAGRHVLMEKPIERTCRAARQLVELCERAGVTLGVVFQHRFRAASLKLKEIIDAGTLGAICAVRVDVPWWRPQSYYDEPGRGTYERDGGGVLISQAIHTLDLMLHLVGPVDEVQAIAATTRLHGMDAEDFVGAGLRFAGGAPGAFSATTAAFPGKSETIAIDFERGSAELAAGILTVMTHDGSVERHGEETGTGGGADPMAFPHDWHLAVIADFVEAIRHDRPPAVTGRDALAVHHLIDALVLSARERRAVRVSEVAEAAAAPEPSKP